MNVKIKVIPIVIGVLRTIHRGLVRRQEDLEIIEQVKTIHTTASFRLARVLRNILDTWEDLLLLKLLWKTII